jgi:predicted GIY-YIG superfamily endonuclease
VERCATIVEALVKKTTLAKWKRDNKVALIREYNPERSDLTKERCGTWV